jgi:hypothetical protein
MEISSFSTSGLLANLTRFVRSVLWVVISCVVWFFEFFERTASSSGFLTIPESKNYRLWLFQKPVATGGCTERTGGSFSGSLSFYAF